MKTDHVTGPTISAIVPTIGRPSSLRDLLRSLGRQTMAVTEVVVADGSPNDETEVVANDAQWRREGLIVRHLRVQPPNAVRQRQAAIKESIGELLLLLDDDVVLEPDCVEQLAKEMRMGSEIVAVTADLLNESWSRPTKPWRWYMRYVLRLKEDEWQGRVLGPLLRFGYYIPNSTTRAVEWMGTGNSLVSKSAYLRAGGFSNFFLHRCTTNEDVDISLKLTRFGTILLCPKAKLSHYHSPSGRLSPGKVAADDLYNRFFVLHRTIGYKKSKAIRLVLLYYFVETTSDLVGLVRGQHSSRRAKRIVGRSHAMHLIASQSITLKNRQLAG